MRATSQNMVYELAKRDPRVLFIGSDLSPGLLAEMQKEMPDRYYMEGVTEANLIGMSAGLAMEGFIPYANTIATFITRRCYEQVAIDLCLHNLPVRLIGNGGGLVYAPLGPTHLAIEDMAIMRSLPNMTVVAVSDKDEMVRFMNQTLDWPGPIYIRLAKGGDKNISKEENGFTIGKAITMRQGKGRRVPVLMSTGVMTTNCLDAADMLAGQGIDVSVVHFHTVKPLDSDAILRHATDSNLVVTVEEGVKIGGFGSGVADILLEKLDRDHPSIVRLGLPDSFPHHYGSQADHFEINGLAPKQIAETVAKALAGKNLSVPA